MSKSKSFTGNTFLGIRPGTITKSLPKIDKDKVAKRSEKINDAIKKNKNKKNIFTGNTATGVKPGQAKDKSSYTPSKPVQKPVQKPTNKSVVTPTTGYSVTKPIGRQVLDSYQTLKKAYSFSGGSEIGAKARVKAIADNKGRNAFEGFTLDQDTHDKYIDLGETWKDDLHTLDLYKKLEASGGEDFTEEELRALSDNLKIWQDYYNKYTVTKKIYNLKTGKYDKVEALKSNSPLPPWVAHTPENIEIWRYYTEYMDATRDEQIEALDTAKQEREYAEKYGYKDAFSGDATHSRGTADSLIDAVIADIGESKGNSASNTLQYLNDYVVNPIKAGKFGVFAKNRLYSLFDVMDTFARGARAVAAGQTALGGTAEFEDQATYWAHDIEGYDDEQIHKAQKEFIKNGGKELLAKKYGFYLDDSKAFMTSDLMQLSTEDLEAQIFNGLPESTKKLYHAILSQIESEYLSRSITERISDFKTNAVNNLKDAYTVAGADFNADTGSVLGDMVLELGTDPGFVIGGMAKTIAKNGVREISEDAFKHGLVSVFNELDVNKVMSNKQVRRAIRSFDNLHEGSHIIFKNKDDIRASVDILEGLLKESGIDSFKDATRMQSFKDILNTDLLEQKRVMNANVLASSEVANKNLNDRLVRTAWKLDHAIDSIDTMLIKSAFPEPFLLRDAGILVKKGAAASSLGKYLKNKKLRIDEVVREAVIAKSDGARAATEKLSQVRIASGATDKDIQKGVRIIRSHFDDASAAIKRTIKDIRSGSTTIADAKESVEQFIKAVTNGDYKTIDELSDWVDSLDTLYKAEYSDALDILKREYEDFNMTAERLQNKVSDAFLNELKSLPVTAVKEDYSAIFNKYSASVDVFNLRNKLETVMPKGLVDELIKETEEALTAGLPIDNGDVMRALFKVDNAANSTIQVRNINGHDFNEMIYTSEHLKLATHNHKLLTTTGKNFSWVFNDLRRLIGHPTKDLDFPTIYRAIDNSLFKLNYFLQNGGRLTDGSVDRQVSRSYAELMALQDKLRGLDTVAINDVETITQYHLDTFTAFTSMLENSSIRGMLDYTDELRRTLGSDLDDVVKTLEDPGLIMDIHAVFKHKDHIDAFEKFDTQIRAIPGINERKAYAIESALLNQYGSRDLLTEITRRPDGIWDYINTTLYNNFGGSKLNMNTLNEHMRSLLTSSPTDMFADSGKFAEELRQEGNEELRRWFEKIVNADFNDPQAYADKQMLAVLLMDSDTVRQYNKLAAEGETPIFIHLSSTGLNSDLDSITGIGYRKWVSVPDPDNITLSDIRKMFSEDIESFKVRMLDEDIKNISYSTLKAIFRSEEPLSVLRSRFKRLFGGADVHTESDILEEFFKMLDSENNYRFIVHDLESVNGANGFNLRMLNSRAGLADAKTHPYTARYFSKQARKAADDTLNTLSGLRNKIDDNGLTTEEFYAVEREIKRYALRRNEIGKLKYSIFDFDEMESKLINLKDKVNYSKRKTDASDIATKIKQFADNSTFDVDGVDEAIYNVESLNSMAKSHMAITNNMRPRVAFTDAAYYRNTESQLTQAFQNISNNLGLNITFDSLSNDLGYYYINNNGKADILLNPYEQAGTLYNAFSHELRHIWSKSNNFGVGFKQRINDSLLNILSEDEILRTIYGDGYIPATFVDDPDYLRMLEETVLPAVEDLPEEPFIDFSLIPDEELSMDNPAMREEALRRGIKTQEEIDYWENFFDPKVIAEDTKNITPIGTSVDEIADREHLIQLAIEQIKSGEYTISTSTVPSVETSDLALKEYIKLQSRYTNIEPLSDEWFEEFVAPLFQTYFADLDAHEAVRNYMLSKGFADTVEGQAALSFLDDYSLIAKNQKQLAEWDGGRFPTSIQPEFVEPLIKDCIHVLVHDEDMLEEFAQSLLNVVGDRQALRNHLLDALSTGDAVRTSRLGEGMQVLNARVKTNFNDIRNYFSLGDTLSIGSSKNNLLDSISVSVPTLERMGDIADDIKRIRNTDITSAAETILEPYSDGFAGFVKKIQEIAMLSTEAGSSRWDYIRYIDIADNHSAVDRYLICQQLYDDVVKYVYNEDIMPSKFIDDIKALLNSEEVDSEILSILKGDYDLKIYKSGNYDDAYRKRLHRAVAGIEDEVEIARAYNNAYYDITDHIRQREHASIRLELNGIKTKRDTRIGQAYASVAEALRNTLYELRGGNKAVKDAIGEMSHNHYQALQQYRLDRLRTDGKFDLDKLVSELLWNGHNHVVFLTDLYTTDEVAELRKFVEDLPKDFILSGYDESTGKLYIALNKNVKVYRDASKPVETRCMQFLDGSFGKSFTRPEFDNLHVDDVIISPSVNAGSKLFAEDKINTYRRLLNAWENIDILSDGASRGTSGRILNSRELEHYYNTLPSFMKDMCNPSNLLHSDYNLSFDPGFILEGETDYMLDMLDTMRYQKNVFNQGTATLAYMFGNGASSRFGKLTYGIPNQDIIEFFGKNSDFVVATTVPNSEFIHGVEVKQLRMDTDRAIDYARETSNAVILPHDVYVTVLSEINRTKNPNSIRMFFNKALLVVKAFQLCNVGSWVRNWYDATKKAGMDMGAEPSNTWTILMYQGKSLRDMNTFRKAIKYYGRDIDEASWEIIKSQLKNPDMTYHDFELLSNMFHSDNLMLDAKYFKNNDKQLISGEDYGVRGLSERDIKDAYKQTYGKTNTLLDENRFIEIHQKLGAAPTAEEVSSFDTMIRQIDNHIRSTRLHDTPKEAINVLFHPFSISENIVRYAQTQYLRDFGMTDGQIAKRIHMTQFGTRRYSSTSDLLEYVVPYANYTYENVMYWMRIIEENPRYFKYFTDAYSNFVSEHIEDLLDKGQQFDSDRDNMVKTGGVPLGNGGLYFKLNPSFLDFVDNMYGGTTNLLNKVNPLLNIATRYTMSEMGLYAKYFFSDLDLNINEDDVAYEVSSVTPVVNKLYNYYRQFNRASDYFGEDTGMSTKLIFTLFSSLLGIQYNYATPDKVDFEDWQAELAKQGKWYDANRGVIVDISEKNTSGANDPNISWEDRNMYQLMHFGKVWDGNQGKFVHYWDYIPGDFNQEFDFEKDPTAWGRLEKLYKDKKGMVFDYNIGHFVKESDLTPGDLNDPNISWEEKQALMFSKFGKVWDANRNHFVLEADFIPGGLNDPNLNYKQKAALRLALFGKVWDDEAQTYVNVQEPTAVYLSQLQDDNSDDLYNLLGIPQLAKAISKIKINRDGVLVTEDGKYVLTDNLKYNQHVFDILTAPYEFTGRRWRNFGRWNKWRNYSWRHFTSYPKRPYTPKFYPKKYYYDSYYKEPESFFRFEYQYNYQYHSPQPGRALRNFTAPRVHYPYGNGFSKYSYYTR